MRRHFDFEQDIRDRQRNLVYPETLSNEMRGYRALLQSSRPLSSVQKAGLIILGFVYAPLGLLMFFAALVTPRIVLEETHSVLITLIIGIASLATAAGGIGFFLLGYRMCRRVVRSGRLEHRPPE